MCSFTLFFVRSFSPVSVRWTVESLTWLFGYPFAHPVNCLLVLPLARSFAFLVSGFLSCSFDCVVVQAFGCGICSFWLVFAWLFVSLASKSFIGLCGSRRVFTRLSVCLLLPCFRIVQSSSPVLLVTRFLQFFHGHNPFNLKILTAILKHLKTFLHVLIFKVHLTPNFLLA